LGDADAQGRDGPLIKDECIDEVSLYTDGGCRGNPGPGAIGILICDAASTVLHEHAECIGHTTNNQAEYRALIKGLACARNTRVVASAVIAIVRS
jgi:ribonuclease HI